MDGVKQIFEETHFNEILERIEKIEINNNLQDQISNLWLENLTHPNNRIINSLINLLIQNKSNIKLTKNILKVIR